MARTTNFFRRINMKLLQYISLLALPLLLGLSSCTHAVFDNLSECPRGVYVRLYAQTECETTPSYPSEIKDVSYFVFDTRDKLVSYHHESNLTLTPDAEVLIELPAKGSYRVFAWAGIDDELFEHTDYVIGQTTLQDIYATLRSEGDQPYDLRDRTVWMGLSSIVSLEELKTLDDPERPTNQYYHTAINMREYTNRITVRVTGLEHPEHFTIKLESDNGRYNYQGDIVPDKTLVYPTKMNYSAPADSTASAFFTTLKLESGRNSFLTVYNKEKGEVAFMEDLIGAILVSPVAEALNMRCLNDYDVHLKMRRCPECPSGYMACEIWINDWLVHSYDIAFE